MKTISSLNQLQPYGIELLTGEACALGMRILCDLTRRGRKIVAEAYGLNPTSFADSWNSGSKEDPHVASIMLDHEAYLFLGVFALMDAGCTRVFRFYPVEARWSHHTKAVQLLRRLKHSEDRVQAVHDIDVELDDLLQVDYHTAVISEHTLYGFEAKDGTADGDDFLARYMQIAKREGWTWRSWAVRGNPHVGTRNVHQMSGRAV